jgi:hypothetical protein
MLREITWGRKVLLPVLTGYAVRFAKIVYPEYVSGRA